MEVKPDARMLRRKLSCAVALLKPGFIYRIIDGRGRKAACTRGDVNPEPHRDTNDILLCSRWVRINVLFRRGGRRKRVRGEFEDFMNIFCLY